MERGADILQGLLHIAGHAVEALAAVAGALGGLSDADFHDMMRELAEEAPGPDAAIVASQCQVEGLKRYLALTLPTSPAHD